MITDDNLKGIYCDLRTDLQKVCSISLIVLVLLKTVKSGFSFSDNFNVMLALLSSITIYHLVFRTASLVLRKKMGGYLSVVFNEC